MTRLSQHKPLTIRPGFVGFFVLCTCALSVASCHAGEKSPASSALVFHDDLGREVVLDGSARRIVSLSPATTELLFAIGAGDRLVGRTEWDVVPEEALTVASVGEGMPPNVEAVASVNPDLVVFYASEVNRGPIEQLDGLGIHSVSVKIDLLNRLPRITRMLGAATGHEARADSIAQSFEDRLDSAVADAALIRERPSVVILTWDNPPIVIGAGSFLNEMLELAGARNAFADIEAPSASVSIEAIAARAPDVLLVTSGTDVPAYATRPEWQSVAAIADRRFAIVQGTEFQWPSLRSIDAIVRLRDAIHKAVTAGADTSGTR